MKSVTLGMRDMIVVDPLGGRRAQNATARVIGEERWGPNPADQPCMATDRDASESAPCLDRLAHYALMLSPLLLRDQTRRGSTRVRAT